MSALPPSAPKSVGEAFAYIEGVQSPSVDDLKLMVFLEAYGFHAYSDLAECAPNQRVRELLEANAREELAHAHRLLEVIKIVSGEDFLVPARRQNPYATDWRRDVTSEVLESRARSEVKGGILYTTWAENIASERAADLLRQSASEEAGHAERMSRASRLVEVVS